MSKFKCNCGNIISDTSDYLPYKAALINDKVEESFFEEVSSEAKSLMEASVSGNLEKWKQKHYNDVGPWSLEPEEIFYSALSSIYLKHFTCIYECQECGRLWVQKKGSETFLPFLPESNKYEGILDEPNKNA